MPSLRKRFVDFLRWSERYTKTDMLYFTKGSFWLMIGQGAASSSSLVLAIAFANLLPAEIYGTYKYILSVAAILTIPTLTGIGAALTQAIARGYEGSYTPALILRLKWGLLGTLGSLFLAGYYFLRGNTELALAFTLISPFIPLVEIFGMYSALFYGKKMFRESSLYFIVNRAVYAIAILCTIVLTNNLYFVLAAYFIPLTCIQLILLLRAAKKYPLNNNAEPHTLRTGVHLSFNGMVSYVSLYLDSILLFHYLGPIGVALYTFAAAPVKQIRASYKNVTTLTLPKLSERSAKNIDSLLLERLGKLFGIGVVIAGSYALVAPFVFSTFLPSYTDAVVYSQLLAGILALELPLVFLGSAVQSRLNVTPDFWLYLRNIPTIFFIVTAVFLTPVYGILGIIFSRYVATISSIITNGIQWYLFVQRE